MAKKNNLSIFWFRRDLRIRDNLALFEAANQSKELICLYIHCPEEESPWEIGGASRWWLHHALIDLNSSLEKLGSKLIIKEGKSLELLSSLSKEFSASAVFWNRLYDPSTIKRDSIIKKSLIDSGIEVKSYSGSLLKEPWEVKNGSGAPYQVFTPFWKSVSKSFEVPDIVPILKKIPPTKLDIPSIELSSLNLLPKIPWDKEFYNYWQPTEKGAWETLSEFILNNIETYKTERDFPYKRASSTLSPYLHFGQITAVSIWRKVLDAFKTSDINSVEPFLRQLGWRDFAHHLLYHFPHTDLKPLKKDFEKFPWEKNKKNLSAWQKGRTGIPIIDAGMRELWTSGIMHNRVRMIVGSYLVKNLRIHWTEGAKWFWDTLIDADLANNTLGWQWVAGSGADAAPYFRIFNPITQSEKFDSQGFYIRKWLPELSSLPDKWIHRPFEAPENILKDANIILGKTYPKPICDLKETREEALEAYFTMKGK
jgi:deoxyribodipyrimidine photo-lyase